MSGKQSQQVNYFSDVASGIFVNKTFLDTRWLPSKEFILARQTQTDRLSEQSREFDRQIEELERQRRELELLKEELKQILRDTPRPQ